LEAQLEDEKVWKNRKKLASIQKEHKSLKSSYSEMQKINNDVEMAQYTLNSLLKDNLIEKNIDLVREMKDLIANADKLLYAIEFKQMFKNEHDSYDAYLDIQSGSGGTEAQDWVSMLMRMYLKWCETHNFTTEIIEASEGEIAGYKSVTIKIHGDYVYGWLRTETGIHRLVRKSPFDSGNRRHTSFASIFVYPQIEDDLNIEINPADIRIDVYRASGAGGQHVNTTESAVRITHLPTNIVVQCQNSRSQHKNKESALKQLRAKLYLYEIEKQNAVKNQIESEKSDIGWGSQIRSYILDDSRVKDLRTKYETGNTQAVLDGELDQFIEESLKAGL
tara:strand:+ start:19930 stop:20931 length:1002 start_codon:yes stop_codon:yes gene_type:complete